MAEGGGGAGGAGGALEMPGWLDGLGRLVERGAGFWQRLGDLESRVYAHELEGIRVERPVYVAGLARAGTTVLLELLAGRPAWPPTATATFPPVYTPILWNRAFGRLYRGDAPAAERAHKDRILVTPDSPEAIEEVLWMRFFPERTLRAGAKSSTPRPRTRPSSASTATTCARSCSCAAGRAISPRATTTSPAWRT
jgi:hypothetical protein